MRKGVHLCSSYTDTIVIYIAVGSWELGCEMFSLQYT